MLTDNISFKCSVLCLLWALLIVPSMAQEAVNVEMNNGNLVSTKLANLTQITFSANETEMILHLKDGEDTFVSLDDMRNITFGAYSENVSGISTPKETNVSLTLSGSLRATSGDGIRSVSIYDAQGMKRFIQTFDNAPTEINIPVSSLCKGVCIVRLQTAATVVIHKIMLD